MSTHQQLNNWEEKPQTPLFPPTSFSSHNQFFINWSSNIYLVRLYFKSYPLKNKLIDFKGYIKKSSIYSNSRLGNARGGTGTLLVTSRNHGRY